MGKRQSDGIDVGSVETHVSFTFYLFAQSSRIECIFVYAIFQPPYSMRCSQTLWVLCTNTQFPFGKHTYICSYIKANPYVKLNPQTHTPFANLHTHNQNAEYFICGRILCMGAKERDKSNRDSGATRQSHKHSIHCARSKRQQSAIRLNTHILFGDFSPFSGDAVPGFMCRVARCWRLSAWREFFFGLCVTIWEQVR